MKSKNDFPDKYRPSRISEIYGQKVIKRVVAKGIDEGSLPHSLMFYGYSGTGKTTFARIIGMGLNCEKGRSSEPCGKCAVCRGVIQASHIAYFELNTANITGIDYMRGLREHFNTGSIDGSENKIFVFDECHRLSKEAQTLLLKEVEDCLSCNYFIFCSTDPEKILKTLRNRCMSFEFKRIPPDEMRRLLHDVCGKERVKYIPEVLEIEDKLFDQVMRFTSEDQKLKFVAKKNWSLYHFLDLVNQHLRQDPGKRKKALDVWLKRKGAILEIQKRYQETIFYTGNPESAKVFQELSGVRARLSKLTFAQPGRENEKSYKQKSIDLKNEKDRLEAQLSRLSQPFAMKQEIAKADCKKIAKVLSPQTALVEFARIATINFKNKDKAKLFLL